MLESKIEEAVCNYAKKSWCLVYKFTSPNRAAVPDRMFVSLSGHIWFCEFKATGKKPTPAQEREHARLRDRGVAVFVIDNIPEGRAMVDLMLMGEK